MRQIRNVLNLKYGNKLSHRQIAKSCGIGVGTVSECLARARKAGLSWPLPEQLDDEALETLLYPSVVSQQPRILPDLAWVHRELKRTGVTLQLLWHEYLQDHPGGYRYSQFCELYKRFRRKLSPSMRQIHRAGEKTFIDFSGKRPHLVDPETGEIQPVELFVGALGASSFTYAEATLSQELDSFIAAHIHMFEYFRGASTILVPDQLKSGVTRPSRYEPGIHRTYEEMAHHYGAVVIPARPGKPRDKAKAEAAVLLAQRWILAALRDRLFFSLGEINQAIRELLVVFNNRPMQKLGVSRRELFEQLDRPTLHPLPSSRYEIGRWKTCTVSIDYHVEVEHNYYSVPFPLIKEIVEARFTRSTVEIFHKSKRITSHQRLYGRGKHATKPEHMPASHRAHAEWSPSGLISWAQKSGPATGRLVTCILQSRPHPEQGYRACLGIMRMGRTYGHDRLEAASQRALDLHACSYRTIKNILASGADRLALDDDRLEQTAPHHDNIRGADYYESQPETNRKEILCSTKQPSRR